MTEHHFDTYEPVALLTEIGKGRVDVTATETEQTHVEISGRDADQVEVHQDGRQISVVAPRRGGLFGGDSRLDVRITVPTGSDVILRTGSADIAVAGTIGTGHIKSGSGDAQVEAATGPLLAETGSGNVRIGDAQDAVKIKSGSGDVVIRDAAGVTSISTGSGDVRVVSAGGQTVVKTGSGDLEVADAAHDVSLTTGSGDLVVSRAHRGRVSAKGASGDVRVGVPAGVPVWTDISTVTGDIRSNLTGAGRPEPGGDHVEIRARTVSGDIVLAEV
ncbi:MULTISPECIES: DUF4097 family beta strand repeat-containing protein [unclassified Nocardioides]|uniref:DUF4097 family beta strand repeat-containing protein n=1 Tax=unclassified Nocardioides TaxID=2615069 RepID=UPI00360D9956